MHKRHLSLSQKALLAVSLILLPVIITFTYGYYKNKRLFKDHVIDDLTVVAEAYEGQVYQFIEMSRRRAEDFSSDGFIVGALKAEGAERRRAAASLTKHLLEKKLSLDRHIDAINIIGPDGIVLSSTDGAYAGRDLSAEKFFIDGRVKSSVTEVVDERGRAELVLSTPVTGPGGRAIGVLANHILLSELSDVLSGEFHKELGAITWGKGRRRTMDAYLVNREGLIVAGSNLKREEAFVKRVATKPVEACISGNREITDFYANYLGVEVVGASMCIPSLGWTLIVEYNSNEALASASEMRREAVTAAVVIGTLIILLFIFFRSITQQLRTLSSAAHAVSQGDYDITIPVKTHDEIGMLAGAFNSMARDIKNRSLELKESRKRFESILNNSAAVVSMKDTEGRYIFVNHKFESLFNVRSEEVKGKTDRDIFPAERADAFRKNDLKVLDAEAPLEFEEQARLNGVLHTYISVKFPLFTAEGSVYAVCGFSTDITERKRAEEALLQTEERLTMAQKVGCIGSWDWNIKDNTLWWSDEIYWIFGLEPHEFEATYEAFIERIHPDDRDDVKRAVKEAVYGDKPYSIDHRITLRDGSERMVHEQADVYFDSTGAPVRMVGTVQDVTEQRKKDFELKKLSMTIEQSVNLIFITDTKGIIEYVNPMFEKVTGYSSKDAIGQTPRILSSGDVSDKEYAELWRTILSGKTWRGNYKNRKRDGGYYWCSTVISPIKNELGKITNFLAVQEDVTQKKFSEERIKYIAHHDELTGLYNRTRFIELLDEWISFASTCSEEGALLLIDMDNFKDINDINGMGVGDDFIVRLARHFTSTLNRIKAARTGGASKVPVISRISGDEFAVLLPSFTVDEGLRAAEEFRVDAEQFHTVKPRLSTTASIGVVSYPIHGTTTRELLTKADASMYRAKELGKNRAHLYRPEDMDIEKLHSRLSWKEKIQRALAEDRFTPWFQPILGLADDRVHHFEALARLRDTDGTILLPGSFIDIAERFSLIGAIDRSVAKKTMLAQARTEKEGRAISFSMNLSGKDLGDDDLLLFLKGAIAETGANPDRLIFEITETAAIADLERAIEFIQSLKALGCHFSLDDFGVGFTSFTYLREMKVDYIKIDGSFIKQLPDNPHDQVFVKAMTDVARSLGVKAVAEFVETEQTYLLLKELGVDYAQGYLIGKPAPELIKEDAFIARHISARKAAG